MNYVAQLAALPERRGIRTAVLLDGDCQGHRIIFTPGLVLGCEPKDSPLLSSLPVLSMIPESCALSLGGRRVFLEVLEDTPRLVLCGAGHVSLALIQMAGLLELPVTVLEDREEFAQRAREAGAAQVICAPFEQALEDFPGSPDTYFVILTREHLYDRKCLEKILPKEWAYLGMMGSAGRVELVRRQMLAAGADPERLALLHAPVGLEIGAETPQEIALSILAEIVQTRRQGQQGSGYSAALLRAAPAGGVLATIVAKEGSAPRGIGTKMLLTPDGQTGTIGGGLLEADVLRAGREMLASGERYRLAPFALTPARTQETMACGGAVEVFLERLDGKDGA